MQWHYPRGERFSTDSRKHKKKVLGRNSGLLPVLYCIICLLEFKGCMFVIFSDLFRIHELFTSSKVPLNAGGNG